jgi:hypothetical protein
MKKIIAIILTLAVVLSFTIAANTDDKKATITDALEILMYLAGMESIYDGTGISPTIEDALGVLIYLAGMVDSVVVPIWSATEPSVITTEPPVTVNSDFKIKTILEPSINSGYTIIMIGDSLFRIISDGWDGSPMWDGILRDGETGAVILRGEYNHLGDFSEGLAAISARDHMNYDGEWGFINTKGEIVIPVEYASVKKFSEGLAAVQRDGKWGFINKKDEVVIPFEYDVVDNFSGGLAAVRKGDWGTGKWGFINTKGEVVIQFDYVYADGFDGGLAAVRKGDWETGKVGFINKSGETMIPFEFDETKKIGENIDLSRAVAVWEFYDEDGRIIIIQEHNDEILSAVKKGDKWGLIDKSGKFIIPVEYDYAPQIRLFFEGLSKEQRENGTGFINKNGDVVIPCKYSIVFNFSDGLAAVGVWYPSRGVHEFGFVDSKGEIVIPIEYGAVNSFINGLAFVSMEHERGKWGIINKKNETVLPVVYDSIVHVKSDNGTEYYWVSKDRLWGIIAISKT